MCRLAPWGPLSPLGSFVECSFHHTLFSHFVILFPLRKHPSFMIMESLVTFGHVCEEEAFFFGKTFFFFCYAFVAAVLCKIAFLPYQLFSS